MALHFQQADPVVLGSGELYLGKVDNVETADEATIVAALKNVGAIESGATLQYSNQVTEVKSANRGTLMRFISNEEVKFNCGVLTWIIDSLALLAPATVDTDPVTRTKKVKIGGKGMLPVNYLRFVHKKKDGSGELIINIYKVQSTNGFQFTFDNENPLTVNYEFSALSDNNGNLCEIIETFNPEKEVLTVDASNQVTLAQTPDTIVGVWLSADGVTKGTEQVVGSPAGAEGVYSLSGNVITLNAVSAPENTLVIVEYYV